MRNVSVRFISMLALIGGLAAVPNVGQAQVAVYDPAAVAAAGYTPVYYIDHLVFFDAYGRPYYHDNGQAYYVPQNYAEYNLLANHYRMYQNQYLAWYQAAGHRLLNYRRPVAASYYRPQYFQGSVVYYDGYGRPMYYLDGTRYYVPVGSPYYQGYVRHWRRNRGHYNRWYRDYGRVYTNYRRAPVVGYYTPQYYQGYVVYYDGTGTPYYWAGGRRTWVPRTSPYYTRYHSHWRTNRTHYSRWQRENGTRYRNYRRPAHLRSRTTYRVPQNRFRPGHHRPGVRGPGHRGGRVQPGHRGGRVQPGHRGGRVQPGHRGGRVQPGHRGGRVQPGHRGGRVQPGHRGGRAQPARQPRRDNRRDARRDNRRDNRRQPAGRAPRRDNRRR